ncbi:MAG: PEP-CTERM sorting domain-containing protein [Bythopirellula sp.]
MEFNDPTDFTSGGSWTVVGKADEQGIAAVVLALDDLLFANGFLIPADVFQLRLSQTIGSAIEIVNISDLVAPVLDVGVIGGTYPSSYVDDPLLMILGGNPDLGSFSGGVEIVTGTFDPGQAPDFTTIVPIDSTTAGNVFDGSGAVVAASVATTVRFVGVPEPATLALLSIGSIGVVALRRRR